MKLLRSSADALIQLNQVSGAFLKLGFRQSISYPLRMATAQIGPFVPVFIFYFVARLVDRPAANFGGDYFAFVVLGLVGLRILDGGLKGLSMQMDAAIDRGWLEMFLVEPVRWRFLPIGMSQWPSVQALAGVLVMILISIALGASYEPRGTLLALLVVVMGLVAGLAVATLATSMAVLAKSGDPVLFVYSLVAQIFSGVYFNLEVLPEPLRLLSWVIPHTYVIQALRKLLLPEAAAMPGLSASTSIVALVGFTVIMYPLSLWIYGRALAAGRKLGVLSGY